MSTAETAIVVDHALSTKENLGLAIDVALAYGELHARVLKDGMEEVGRLVRRRLGAEHVYIENDFANDPLGRDAGLYVRRPEWVPGVHVGVEAEGANDRKGFIGVSQPQDATVDVPSTASLNEVLVRQGRANAWWTWWVYLDEPYQYLDNKEALLAFWVPPSGSSDAAAFLSDRIVSVVKAVDGLLTS